MIKDTLFNIQLLEKKQLQLQKEIYTVEGLMQQYMNENKCTLSEQMEYQKRYNRLAEHLYSAKNRFDEVNYIIKKKQEQREKIEIFLNKLKEQEEIIADFDENLWYSLIEYITIFSKEEIYFTFKDGTEIKV